MRGLKKSLLEMQIAQRYFELHQTPGQISREMGVPRVKVMEIVAYTTSARLDVVSKSHIVGLVRDSIAALAATAEELKDQADLAASLPILPPDADAKKRDVFLQHKRRNTIEMYRTLYDCIAPLVQEVAQREAISATVVEMMPPPDEPALIGQPDEAAAVPEPVQ